MKLLTTIFLLFLTTSYALAEDKDPSDDRREYDIEIIIFEDAHARYLNSESWNQDTPDETESLTGISANNKPDENLKKIAVKETNKLPHEPLKANILYGEYKNIKHSSQYNVLFYSAWRQAGLDKANAFEIDINDLINKHKSKSANSISGNVKIVLARYLHFYADLNYQRPIVNNEVSTDTIDANVDASAQTTETDLISKQSYPMQMHRRMRSKELHYIDHPLVGLLIQINPTEKAEKEETKKQ